MFFVLFTVLVIAGMKTVANSCNYVSKKSFVHAEGFQDIMIVKLGAEFQVTVIGCSYAIMAVLWRSFHLMFGFDVMESVSENFSITDHTKFYPAEVCFSGFGQQTITTKKVLTSQSSY